MAITNTDGTDLSSFFNRVYLYNIIIDKDSNGSVIDAKFELTVSRIYIPYPAWSLEMSDEYIVIGNPSYEDVSGN